MLSGTPFTSGSAARNRGPLKCSPERAAQCSPRLAHGARHVEPTCQAQLLGRGGRIDGQTLRGKAPYGVAQLAAAADIPVIALGASLADLAEDAVAGVFDAIEAVVTRPMTLDEAMRDARINTVRAGARIGAWLRLGRRLRE